MSKPAKVFVQYKGTNICLDFTCGECGSGGHFDGYFAYALECGVCNQVWVMPDTFAPMRLEDASSHSRNWHSQGVPVDMA
jgi:hypothetical protein